MIPKDRVSAEQWEAYGAFAVCETLTEVLVALNKLQGPQGVAQLLNDTDSTKEDLRTTALQLRRAGLRDLAAVVGQATRRVKS